jgi:DNA ligase-1
MSDIFRTFQLCEQDSSQTGKLAALKDGASPTLQKVLRYALDPYKVFGIKKFEFLEPNHQLGLTQFDPWPYVFECLEKMNNRMVTGDAAREEIKKVSALLTSEEQEVFGRILKKDLRCGVAGGLVNRVFPKLIPTFEIQLAMPPKHVDKIIYPALVQAKFDGVRTIALVDPAEGSVVYYSRNGKVFLNFDCFDEELLLLAGNGAKMFDGEVVGPSGDAFRGIMQQCRRKYDVEPKGLSLRIFDWLPLHHFTSRSSTTQQEERTTTLDSIENRLKEVPGDKRRVFIVGSVAAYSYEECQKYFESCVQSGYEGVIVKDLHGEYEFKRSNSWIKIKPTNTEDLKVVGVEEGNGKYAGRIGAFVVDRNGVKVRVGSGLVDEERLDIENAQSLIGQTIEVLYDSVTPDGSLRFPRFVRIREDK